MSRYEVPASIIVEAASEDEAHALALGLGAYLDGRDAPITTAVVGWPVEVTRRDLTVAAHAEGLQVEKGMQ